MWLAGKTIGTVDPHERHDRMKSLTSMKRYFPFLDLRSYRAEFLWRDFLASVSVVFLDVPQGVAYAMIAGLPPVMGLYAAAIPAIVGALFRSSRYVVTGPTNALSLLVGSAVASQVMQGGASPLEVGVTLAFMVGALQLLAGLLRLDVVADYISQPVVRGYITGAAVLIVIGQLPNVAGTKGGEGHLGQVLLPWAIGLWHTHWLTLAFACGALSIIVGLRRAVPHIPGSALVMLSSIVISKIFHLHDFGLKLVKDLAPIPAGLPPFTTPHLSLLTGLAPAAIACAVLSLVESSSVARALASQSGQRLDLAAEFAGQGLANLAAAFSGGYPVSGSLGRSMLNQRAGSASRLSAVFCGLLTISILLFLGPLVGETPVASLAGLLLVLANDLIDRDQIKLILRGTRTDKVAFLATLLGAWTLPLDQAIYLGVGISIVMFLRRVRMLSVREMVIGEKGRFREVDPDSSEARQWCTAIRILNLTGPLFFAVTGELENALDPFLRDSTVRVVILRLRQAHDIDITTATALAATARRFASTGRVLILLGLRHSTQELVERSGLADLIGQENIFPAQAGWFTAMEAALRRALTITGGHTCGSHCPLEEYVAAQEELRLTAQTTIAS